MKSVQIRREINPMEHLETIMRGVKKASLVTTKVGNKVNISQGAQVMLSVIGDGTFLPFNAALFMTTIMDNSMVAQNTCLQMCVIGKNTFIGAGSTFTDFNFKYY